MIRALPGEDGSTVFRWDTNAPEGGAQLSSALSAVVTAIEAGGDASDEKIARLANAAAAAMAAAVVAGVPLELMVFGAATILTPEVQAYGAAIHRQEKVKPVHERAQRASVVAYLGISFARINAIPAGQIAAYLYQVDGPGLVAVGAAAGNVAGHICSCRSHCPTCQANEIRGQAKQIIIPPRGRA